MIGEGFTKDGQFPFIDQYNIKNLQKSRIYQSVYTDRLEKIQTIKDLKKGEVLVQIQSKNDFPNYFLRNIRKKDARREKKEGLFIRRTPWPTE